jgi:hypothetical protein
MAPVGLTTVVSRLCVHGSSGIPGLQSQTVDAADADRLTPGEAADEEAADVAADEHEAAREQAASSPAALAANSKT